MKLNTDNNNRILIRNGTVRDGNALYKSDILICGGIISKISKSINDNADFCFNAENMIVSAGLTDFHTHIKGISPEHIGIDYENISYPIGVTHLIDASAEIGDINNVLNSNVDISVLARVHIFGNKADFTLTEEILEKYSDKVIGLKVYLDTSFTEVTDVRPLAEICKYARKRNLFVAVYSLLSMVCLPTSFYQRSANHVYFYLFLNLRNLLYLRVCGQEVGLNTRGREKPCIQKKSIAEHLKFTKKPNP